MLLSVERCVTVSLFFLALPFSIIQDPVGPRKSDGRQDPRAAALGLFSCERSLSNDKECEKRFFIAIVNQSQEKVHKIRVKGFLLHTFLFQKRNKAAVEFMNRTIQ